MGAALALPLESPWLLRPYDASMAHGDATEQDGMMYFLGVGYTRTRAGIRACADHAGGSKPACAPRDAKKDPAILDRERAFIDAHRHIFAWLLEHADVTLAVDRDNPHRIWAWLVTSGDVVHAVGCKRSLISNRLSTEVVGELLGDRMKRHQVCSLELPQMRTRGSEAIGIDRPSSWSLDPTWLITRMPR